MRQRRHGHGPRAGERRIRASKHRSERETSFVIQRTNAALN